MRKALLDTDIFSEIVRDKNPRVRAQAEAYLVSFDRFTISTITVMEVAKGFHKARRETELQRFLSTLGGIEVLTLTDEAAVTAGCIYADLERAGQGVGRADPMIAGIALAGELVLATGNVDHYDRIRKLGYALDVENWRHPDL